MELAGLRRVLFDSSACLYYLAGSDETRRAKMLPVVSEAEQDRTDILVSAVTVTELLAGVVGSGRLDEEVGLRMFLYSIAEVIPVGLAAAEEAARLRSDYGMATPDAIICATALVEGVDAAIGNDQRWKRVTGLPYLHIDDV